MEQQPSSELELTPSEYFAWAAGFFEGEGCIGITKDYTLHVRVSQIDREPLERLKALFPGARGRGKNIRNKLTTGNRKAALEWSICNKRAVDFLLAIRKYVSRKRVLDRIQLAIEFQQTKTDRTRPTQERRNLMDGAYCALKQLNRAGVTNPPVVAGERCVFELPPQTNEPRG